MSTSAAPLAARRPRYNSLDHWRGIACLFVIVYHSSIYAVHDNHFSPSHVGSWLIAIAQRLWIGVPIFFVISGYCIAATADSTRRNGKHWQFFVRRLRRIFPPYWICVALFLVVVWAGEVLHPGLFFDNLFPVSLPWKFGFWRWIGNLTLSETWRPHLVGAAHHGVSGFFLGHAWTLAYEEQFYVVTGLLLVFCSRRFFLSAGILSVLTLIADRAAEHYRVPVSGFFFAEGRWLQFAAGIAVYYCINYAVPWQRYTLAGVLWIGVIYAARSPEMLLAPTAGTRLYLFVSAIFALLILALYRFDHQLFTMPSLQPIRICGTMCYSLYLVHWPICKAIAHLMYLNNVRGNLATLTITIPICIVVSVAVGWSFHVLVERRFLNTPSPAPAQDKPVTPEPTRSPILEMDDDLELQAT